jgi:hypothetical protein
MERIIVTDHALKRFKKRIGGAEGTDESSILENFWELFIKCKGKGCTSSGSPIRAGYDADGRKINFVLDPNGERVKTIIVKTHDHSKKASDVIHREQIEADKERDQLRNAGWVWGNKKRIKIR